ncbi:MAG TPA: hypothetical protein VNW50_05730 [Streptosporangiaceae bacterium]|jgi:hypothetical protein|nr:hypothetical protein [Streptosporangiaceae bacterium]
MTSAKPRPRWFFLITPRWLAWHAFAVFAAWGMLWLGDWQFHRAEGGNALSWAYTFEWPIFTIFGVVFWAKTIIDEYRTPGGAANTGAATSGLSASGLSVLGEELPGRAHIAVMLDEEADDDPELAAYNAYLAKLHTRS